MKAAVIGLGVMGLFHARVYHEVGVLDAVFDLDTLKTAEVCSSYRCNGYNTLEAILKTKPDVVTIAVPTPYHYKITKACLEAGCHVLVEKPICLKIADGQTLIDLAEEKGLVLAVGYIERFNPAVQDLIEAIIHRKDCGDVTSVNIKRVGGIPRSADNVIFDLMSHDFNILTALFQQEPDRVVTHKQERNGIIDSAQVLLSFGSASATCESNWISPVKIRRIEVTGTGCCLVADLIAQTVTYISTDRILTKQFHGEPLKLELKNFIGKTLGLDYCNQIITGDDALLALSITEKAMQS